MENNGLRLYLKKNSMKESELESTFHFLSESRVGVKQKNGVAVGVELKKYLRVGVRVLSILLRLANPGLILTCNRIIVATNYISCYFKVDTELQGIMS